MPEPGGLLKLQRWLVAQGLIYLLNKYHECTLDCCKSSSPRLHPPSSGLSAVNVIDVGGDIC